MMSDRRLDAAARTLLRMGFTWDGGELWKPPLGDMPKPLRYKLMIETDLADGGDYIEWIFENEGTATAAFEALKQSKVMTCKSIRLHEEKTLIDTRWMTVCIHKADKNADTDHDAPR